MASESSPMGDSSIAPQSAPLAPLVPSSTLVVSPKVRPNSGVLWKRIGLGVAIVALGAAGVGYGAWSSWEHGASIAPGVFINGENIGGLSRDVAKTRLKNRFGKLALQIETPERPYMLGLTKLGGRLQFDGAVDKAYRFGREGALPKKVLDVWRARETEQRLALPIRWDKAQLRKTMWQVAMQYNRAAQNARLEVQSDVMLVAPESAGRKMNVGATLTSLQKMYYAGKPSIKATTLDVPAHITAASLDGVNVELGHYSTSFDSDLRGRTRNIHVAAEAASGTILMPGDTFSFNRATGERTWEKGYRMGHIFERKPGKEKAEVVDGLAGGVCQVSSTLFNAVRRSNKKVEKKIEIVERNTHSLPVSYVPSGLDATVAWPDKDLKFRNSFAYPIFLRADVHGSELMIRVWARVPPALAASLVDAKPKSAPQAKKS